MLPEDASSFALAGKQWQKVANYAMAEMERKAKEIGQPFDVEFIREWLAYRLMVQWMFQPPKGCIFDE